MYATRNALHAHRAPLMEYSRPEGRRRRREKREARLYISNKSTAPYALGFPLALPFSIPRFDSGAAPSLFLIRIHYWYAPGYTARNVRSQAEFSYLS